MDYVRELRKQLPREFPDLTFFFQPADIVSQILNFGLPAPIDVQVVGPLRNLRKRITDCGGNVARRIATIPGTADIHVHQVNDVPDDAHGREPRTRAANWAIRKRTSPAAC